MSNFKKLAAGYWLLIIGLFLYSYTQVDLNLTLSQWSIWQIIQKSFQHIGWFNRPLSTLIYLIIILLLATSYLLLLWLIKKNKVTVPQLWWLVIPTSIILLFSYNAFSYDLFNYIFDARIFTLHQQNPYLYRALDFPHDPWINFMRWTHRTYPYGPVWLGLTIPLSYLGFQVFLPTLFIFKTLMVGSYLGTTYFIGKIMEKINPRQKLFAIGLFALNPLVIIESLVSAHHDIVMILLLTWGIFMFLNKKYFRAFLLLFLSAGIKFATLPLIPIFVIILFLSLAKKTVDWRLIFNISTIIIILSIILASGRTEFQPWYLLWLIPFVSLTRTNLLMTISFIILSFGLLLHYVPFLYSGNWDPPIPAIKLWITTLSLLIGFVFWKIVQKRREMI